MAQNYLHECLGQFPEVSKKLWKKGKPFNLKALEKEVEVLQSGKVSVQDILKRFENLKNPEYWWFNKYWLLPSLNDLSQEQQKKIFYFHQLSRGNENKTNEKDVIQNLLEVFRHIELVSIILRFIRPESFGILSPPVQHVLALPSGSDYVETYVNYLNNLRDIRDKYKLHTAAKADMALWVLEHKCYYSEMVDSKIDQAFKEDEFMLQLRAKNLVTPLHKLSSARLASALYDQEKPNRLASLVGCYALEENVKQWALNEGMEKEAESLAKKDRTTLDDRIKALAAKGILSDLERGKLERLKNIRNDVFHAEVEKLTPHDATDLVNTVLEIEQRLKQRRQIEG